jgi:hypothetical protein
MQVILPGDLAELMRFDESPRYRRRKQRGLTRSGGPAGVGCPLGARLKDMTEYVDVGVDFEVDVVEDLIPADAPGGTAIVKPGRYSVVAIRHWPAKLIPGSGTIRAGDIWYGLDIGNKAVWVRAVETTPDASQVRPERRT